MSVKISDKIADVDGVPVHYRDAGAGEETIIFLHGAGGAPPRGADFVSLLGEAHRVLIPSRPGFDDTPMGSCTSYKDVADVIAKFIRRIAGGPVHIVAQSAGSTIGLWLAVEHSDLVKSLTLSAPAAFAPRPAPGGTQAMPSSEELARRLYGDAPSWSAPPTEEEHARTRKNAAAYMAMFRNEDGNPGLLARLKEIKAPTLVVMASADQVVPGEAMVPYQRAIPWVYRMVIYGAAHELPISAAPRWVNLVADFIDRGEAFVVNIGNQASAAQ
jgi:pimeloyl-ACP methyl ester carboxylesterase